MLLKRFQLINKKFEKLNFNILKIVIYNFNKFLKIKLRIIILIFIKDN